MNNKPAHLKKDSNPYRQKKNEEDKKQLKGQFSKSDLMNVPEHFYLRNEKVYQSLVINLDELGLALHLKNVDVYSLVSIANTFDLISETEKNLKEIGSFQQIETREGVKYVATPFVQMRSTNLNLLQSQLKQLQLDPASRQLLTESVLNDVNMISDEIDEDDGLMSSILERLN